MSLEVKVYKEISAYRAKVMWGMSWCQIATVAVGLPLIGGTYAALYLTGHADLGEWVIVILTIPFVLFGWVRPLGLHSEQWAKYFITSHRENQKLTYHHADTSRANESTHSHDRNTHARPRRRRRLTETGN